MCFSFLRYWATNLTALKRVSLFCLQTFGAIDHLLSFDPRGLTRADRLSSAHCEFLDCVLGKTGI
jgi:hypothetical protein